MLKALDLLRFVAQLPAVPAARCSPSNAAAEHDAAAEDRDIWSQRWDFRELLSAASVLSPECCGWPAAELPQWGFVHRRGMLEQGQDAAELLAEMPAGAAGSTAMLAAADNSIQGAAKEAAEAAREAVANPLRRLVAGDKSRYTDGGFDLNLTYITPRLIAMGVPAQQSLVKMTRNPIDEVARFFETKHGGSYRIYNLCIEQYAAYSPGAFETGAVLHYPCQDHNPPPLAMMHHLALSVKAWLAADPENVAALHCKAGKGRTGVMAVAALLASDPQLDPATGKPVSTADNTRLSHEIVLCVDRLAASS
eukprot:SAG22_NODE_745_length_7499_cov_2.796622_8_plen_308_part_00